MLTWWQDATLKRCFGEDKKIIDCDWNYLKTLRTLREPHEAMPRLKDLLEFLTTPGLEEIWVLLDIKLDNNSDDIMRLIAETLAEVKPTKPWEERILLGCWAVRSSTSRIYQSSKLISVQGKIPPLVLKVLTWIPNYTYWLQHTLRTSVPKGTQRVFQHAPQNHRRARREQLSTRCQSGESIGIFVDSERHSMDEMEHWEGSGWSDH